MKILIVEDSDHNINESIDRLRADGHEVIVARTAVEGLDRLRMGHPEVVLTDLEMPFGSEHDGLISTWVYEGRKMVDRNALVPNAGLVIALAAVEQRVQQVCILTDRDHHHGDPIQHLLDGIETTSYAGKGRPVLREEARNCCLGWLDVTTGERVAREGDRYKDYRKNPEGFRPIKDWWKLFNQMTKTVEELRQQNE